MIVKAIYKNEKYNYFRDKTTAPEIEKQVKRVYGDIFDCDDELAKERIEKGFVKEATKKEKKAYLDSIDNDVPDLKDNDTVNNVDDEKDNEPSIPPLTDDNDKEE